MYVLAVKIASVAYTALSHHSLTHSINVYYVITDKQCGASDRGYAGNMTVLSNKHLEWSYRTQVTHGRISGFLILYTSNSLWGFFCDSDTMSVYKDVFIPRAVSARGGGGVLSPAKAADGDILQTPTTPPPPPPPPPAVVFLTVQYTRTRPVNDRRSRDGGADIHVGGWSSSSCSPPRLSL